ncbi:MAG: twitching motility protein PilT [Acidimicrobiia bacterium]
MGITYDAGALIAAERDNRRMWALHRQALSAGHQPTVPAGALAQAWRGGPQPMLARLLSSCFVEPLDEAHSRSVGAACARARSDDIVDASVVVGAATRGDVVVTSDVGDLQRLADALTMRLQFRAI